MYRLLTLGLFVVATVHGAAISNEVTETPRIHTSEQLISSIMNDCFEVNGMSCLKGKVLTYLDTVLGLKSEQARAFDESNVDKVIYDRVSRVLATNEIRVELPKIIFGDVAVTYRADQGIDFDMTERQGLLKIRKKLCKVLTFTSTHSCTRTSEEETSLPSSAALETENESFNADLCRNHWIKSN